MTNRSRVFVASLFMFLLLTGITGCQTAQEQATPTPIPTPIETQKQTYNVERGAVQSVMQFNARISPTKEEELFFRTGGFVQLVNKERGQTVKQGDVIAELEMEGILNQIAQAQVSLEKSKLSLEEAKTANERQLAESKVNLELKQIKIDKMKEQSPYWSVVIAQKRVEEADNAVKLAQAAYDRISWQPGLEATSAARNLQSATIALEIAKANYQVALQNQAGYKYDMETAVKDLELSQLKHTWLEQGVDPNQVKAVEQSQLALDRLEGQLATMRIIAPMDGIINNISVLKGKQAEAFKPVVVMANQDAYEITAQLSDTEMNNLKENMPVTVTLSSAVKPLPGTISKLPYPFSGGGTAPKLDNADTHTRIALNDTSIQLKAGDSAKVDVLLQRKESTLWLPPAAVRTFEGRNFVVVESEGRQRRIDIKVGIKGSDRIEVLEGLEEGQVVVSQ